DNPGEFTYNYNGGDGKGVNIYILDFEGRAKWADSHFGEGKKKRDMTGHGTHCACIAAGKTFGVAKKANILSVKVLNDDEDGTIEALIAGIEWVMEHVARTNSEKSIISMSLAYAANDLLDEQAHKVSAGNKNEDAKDTSPARSPYVITVGASDIEDERWVDSEEVGSNFGSIVDIYAPGMNIESCNIKKGKAAPHVAGMIARRLSKLGKVSPAEMKEELKKYASKNVLSLKDAFKPLALTCLLISQIVGAGEALRVHEQMTWASTSSITE
ncbi:hypothetical protein H0H92_005109, partial [Tricholoma furcatifolium]